MNRSHPLSVSGLLRTLAAVIALSLPVLAAPSLAGSEGARIEAPSHKQHGMGLMLLVSLQRG